MGRAFTLLVLYGALAFGGLWIADPAHYRLLGGVFAQWRGGEPAQPTDPTAIRRLVERDLHRHAPLPRKDDLPPPGSFLDENGLPRLDPASFARFLEEANLLQERVARHRRELDEKIRAVTR